MTKEEYIESLVSQNLTGKEIVKLAAGFGEEEEEVKTDDVAAQDATVTSTTQEASESSDGESLSDEEKAAAAAKDKETEERINSLYSKYNEDGNQNLSREDKEKWLKENKQEEEDVSGLSWWQNATFFGETEKDRVKRENQDNELKTFRYNQGNDDYLKKIEELSKNNDLTPEQKREELKKIKPPALVEEVDEEIEVQDTADVWKSASITLTTKTDEEIKTSPLFQTDGKFDPKKLEDYNNFIELNDYRDELSSTTFKLKGKYTNPEFTKLYKKLTDKYGEPTKDENGNDIPEQFRKAYLGKHLDNLKKDITKDYDKKLDEDDELTKKEGLFDKDYYTKIRKKQVVSPDALTVALSHLPKDFSAIENEEDLDKTMKQAYSDFVKNDTILNSTWEAIQQGAKSKIEAYQNEIQKTADLTTPEGVAAANAKLQAYAKKVTLDEFEGSEEYKTRMTELGTVMDRAMSDTSTAYKRQQDYFLNFTDLLRGGNTGIDGSDGLPFNNTIANLLESIGKGGVNLYSSGQKAMASVEAKGVRNVQRQIKAIDDKVESGEITKEEGERLKNQSSKTDADGVRRGAGAMFSTKSLMEELMSDKKDVEEYIDSIGDTEAYTNLFNTSDLSDGISFQEAVFTTGEALPQIGLATVGALTGNPILAGLGTAAMFTQMYGDNYWSAYQEGIKKDAEAMGIDLDSMSAKERREFEVNALIEGKHANMATSAGFAAVMTAAEQFGANKILKKTEQALGLGSGGLVSFL